MDCIASLLMMKIIDLYLQGGIFIVDDLFKNLLQIYKEISHANISLRTK
jgi:hypothetical protein